jgi:hypothetical protein
MSDGQKYVTLELLDYKVDSVLTLLADMKPDHERLVVLEGVVTAVVARQAALDGRVERMDVARKWEGRLEALAAGIVAAGAWFRP